MEARIKKSIEDILQSFGVEQPRVSLTHPEDFAHGDFTTNVAMVYAKEIGKQPAECAQMIAGALEKTKNADIALITTVGGFVNITLQQRYFRSVIAELLSQDPFFGTNNHLQGKHFLVEYTDPNPFKQFHIGHLMTNAIGESIARLYESHGAQVTRMNYGGDVGMHVAKALYGMQKMIAELPDESASLSEKTAFLGRAYVTGTTAFEGEYKNEVEDLNKKIYAKDSAIVELYEKGKRWSLEHFEEIYRTLGSKFDRYVFESEVSDRGVDIVRKNTGTVFEIGDGGAIVYKGEKKGLHTRVFITSAGIPTYEAKEIGLDTWKFETYPDIERSIIMTGNEQAEFMRVVMAAFQDFAPHISEKTIHLTHGLMLGADGKKISSRKGTGITGESMITEVIELAEQKIKESAKEISDKDMLSKQIAVGAIKYSILKQAPGKNIIFDFDQSLSFEGDSGPYLQYTHARICSLLQKGKETGIEPALSETENVANVEKLAIRLPEVIARSLQEFSPQTLVGYLIAVAREFNSYYGAHKIIDTENTVASAHRLALAHATQIVLRNGLRILGIQAPEKM